MFSFRFDGPFVPVTILRRQSLACRFVGRLGLARSLLLEAVKQAVNVLSVKDHACTLAHGHQLRPPHFIEGAALHANVIHGLLVGQAAFDRHDFSLGGAGGQSAGFGTLQRTG
jgi:hypothetical protein